MIHYKVDKDGRYRDSIYLDSKDPPLPANLKEITGDLYLYNYPYRLPDGFTRIGGNLYLTQYSHPLPDGLAHIGGSLCLRRFYTHPLPANLAYVGGNLSLIDYAHVLPEKLLTQAPYVRDLDQKILEAIEAGGILDMSEWHTCATTHCRAGWAVHLAGEAGKELEHKHGTEGAGALIYQRSTGRRHPNFYANDAEALADIRRCAGL